MKNTPSDDITSRVLATIASILNIDISTIKTESSFTGDLGADSLDKITLIMALEDEFGGSISDKDASRLTTINDVISFIHDRSSQVTTP